MDSTFYVFLLLVTEIILLSIAFIVFNRDFISPSVVTLALFIVSTSCFAYNTDVWEVIFTFKAYSLFTLSFILMIFTEYFFKKIKIVISNRTYNAIDANKKNNTIVELQPLYIPKFWNRIIVIFVIFGSFYYIHRVYQSGMSLGATGLDAIGLSKEEGDFDTISRLLFNSIRFISYVYAMIFCQNIIGCKQRIIKNISPLIVIGFALINMFFSGQRSVLISYIFGIMVLAGIVLHDIKRRGENINIKKFFKKILYIGLILLIFFYFSKEAVKGKTIDTPFVEYFTYYFGSTISLMGKIVEYPEICHTPFAGYFGEKTFNGFYSALYSVGIVSEEPTSRRWVRIGGLAPTNQAGNEFTFFCSPYIDFGFIGTLIFIVFFYSIFSYLYYKCILYRNPTIKRYNICIIYSYLYILIAMSFYQDTIRSHSRPINILYIIFVTIFVKIFLKMRRPQLKCEVYNERS
jgi:oligosaccharide repeat unit polymerase